MNPHLEAAWEVHQFLARHRLAYAIIGGIAVQRWGEPRFTRDVDLAVAAGSSADLASFVRLITGRFPSRTADPVAFAQATRMVLVSTRHGIDVDISLALPGYEDRVFDRAIDDEIEPGRAIRICSAEDLIIHKAVAGRAQDLADIQGVVHRQGDRLNVAYVREWLDEFARALDRPEIVERFEAAWKNR